MWNKWLLKWGISDLDEHELMRSKKSEMDQKTLDKTELTESESKVKHEPMNSHSVDEPMGKLLEHLRKNWY